MGKLDYRVVVVGKFFVVPKKENHNTKFLYSSGAVVEKEREIVRESKNERKRNG